MSAQKTIVTLLGILAVAGVITVIGQNLLTYNFPMTGDISQANLTMRIYDGTEWITFPNGTGIDCGTCHAGTTVTARMDVNNTGTVAITSIGIQPYNMTGGWTLTWTPAKTTLNPNENITATLTLTIPTGVSAWPKHIGFYLNGAYS
jgi:hypothetical protein